MTRPRGTRRD